MCYSRAFVLLLMAPFLMGAQEQEGPAPGARRGGRGGAGNREFLGLGAAPDPAAAAKGQPLELYVTAWDEPADVLKEYRRLTGATPLPPRWALGYMQSHRTLRGPVPDGDHVVPLGRARVAREGSDVTVVAYGSMVPLAEQAATALAGEASVEVLDLRTLKPLDEDALRLLAGGQVVRELGVVERLEEARDAVSIAYGCAAFTRNAGSAEHIAAAAAGYCRRGCCAGKTLRKFS